MRSNHTAILTAIKFKVTEKIVLQTNWKLIGYHNINNYIFNNSLYISISGSTTYSNYNKHILEVGTNTTTVNNQKNKGWLQFRRNYLLPLIENKGMQFSLLTEP